MHSSPPDASRDQLTGWKEIASYLGKSVRTVQRWERRYAMPVHRLPGSADVVLASKEEIERWKRSEAAQHVAEAVDDAESTGENGASGGAGGAARSAIGAASRAPYRWRRLVVAVLGIAALAVVTFSLLYRGTVVNREADEEDDALFAGGPLALEWKSMEDVRAPQVQSDGLLVDPAWVTFDARTVVFNYTGVHARALARPYAFARLAPSPESPRLQFAYLPAPDARVSHWAGFMANTGFARKGDQAPAYWLPRHGVALRLSRSDQAHVDSRAGLWVVDAGEPRPLVAEQRLRFQLNRGGRYWCTIEIEGRRVTARVSDGARVDELEAVLDSGVAAEAVFITDAAGAAGPPSSKGTYSLRFEDLAVYDAQYKVELLRPASAQPAPGQTMAVVIASNRAVDALALEQASVRLAGVPILPGRSNQGFACRAEQATPDGVYDLVCDFDTQALAGAAGSKDLVLTGRTSDGRRVAGRLRMKD